MEGEYVGAAVGVHVRFREGSEGGVGRFVVACVSCNISLALHGPVHSSVLVAHFHLILDMMNV